MRLILFFICISVFNIVTAQISVSGIPRSFKDSKKQAELIPEMYLGSIDRNAFLKMDSLEGVKNRFGIIKTVDIDIKRDGLKTQIDGGTLWRYILSSENAYSLGITFTNFFLPPGADLYIYNAEHTQILGAFTMLNNNENHYLKIEELFSNLAVIEYFEPENVEFSGMLAISQISLAYKNILSSLQNDIYDINCPDWVHLKDAKHAVCKMIFTEGTGSYLCTGSLINNTKQDYTPFFLTAAHCINTVSAASSLVVYFNYEAKTCGSEEIDVYQTLSGANLIRTISNTDFTLLKLKNIPPLSYKPFYLGWNAQEEEVFNVWGIHHPQGIIKKAAFSSNRISNVAESISWDEGPNSPPNTHWEVIFTKGSTKGGSSGSPLLNNNLQIIGQLHGGENNDNFYGKFSKSWSLGGLKSWLDPINKGVIQFSGIYSNTVPEAGFYINPAQGCINAQIVLVDTSLLNPDSLHWEVNANSNNYEFINGSDNSSKMPKLIFKKAGNYKITLTAANENGSSKTDRFLDVDSVLHVEISQVPSEQICGYMLDKYGLKATGAAYYSFEMQPNNHIDTSSVGNELFLTLNENSYLQSSFVQKVIVTGSHGSCHSQDSIAFKVNIEANDRIENAQLLSLGKSGPFSNECASVQAQEPYPDDGGCTGENTWCYDASNRNVINNTLWFRFIGPNNGNICIATSGFNTRIAIFDANSALDLIAGRATNYKLIAANDDPAISIKEASLTNIEVTPQKTYWLQVDGYKHETGNLYVNLYNNELEVYPNPTRGITNFILARNVSSTGILEVYSPIGTLVYKTEIKNSPESARYQIDLSTKAAGLYTVVMHLDNEMYVKKLVLIH